MDRRLTAGGPAAAPTRSPAGPEVEQALEGPHQSCGAESPAGAPVPVAVPLEIAGGHQALHPPSQHHVEGVVPLELLQAETVLRPSGELDQAPHADRVVGHVEQLIVAGEEEPVDQGAVDPHDRVGPSRKQRRQPGRVLRQQPEERHVPGNAAEPEPQHDKEPPPDLHEVIEDGLDPEEGQECQRRREEPSHAYPPGPRPKNDFRKAKSRACRHTLGVIRYRSPSLVTDPMSSISSSRRATTRSSGYARATSSGVRARPGARSISMRMRAEKPRSTRK